MARWGPDADNRLLQSAMQLFVERGYDQVTVAEIAEHAGLRKRSFFRYFADKREVLFAGADDFQLTVVQGVQAAPIAAAPIDAAVAGLAAAGSELTGWGEPVRQRHRVIASASELRERELIKLDSLSSAIAAALRERGVPALTATLAAQAGVAVFSTAFSRWAESEGAQAFSALMTETLGSLRAAVRRAPPTELP